MSYRKYCYMVVECSIYELPLYVAPTLKDCARWLDIDYQSAKNALCTKSVVHRRYRIEKVIYQSVF